MKKIIRLFMAVCFLLAIPACSPKPEDVAQKVRESKELSQKDYDVALDYVEKGMDEFAIEMKGAKGNPEKMIASAEKLEADYPQMSTMLDALFLAQEKGTLSKDASERLEKVMRNFDSLMQEMRATLMGI